MPCPGYISETIRCRKLIFGKDIGWELYLCNVMGWPGFVLWSFISDTVLSLLYFSYLFTLILVVAPLCVFWWRLSTVKVTLEFFKGFTFATSHCNRWYCIKWVTGYAPNPYISMHCHISMYGKYSKHLNHNSTTHQCDIFIDGYYSVKKFFQLHNFWFTEFSCFNT